MNRIHLGIYSEDRSLPSDLLNSDSAGIGQRSEIFPGAEIECTDWTFHKAFGVPEFLGFVIDAAVNIDLALLATWLYSKVAGKKVQRLVINRKEILEITPQSIRYALEETITKEVD